MANEKFTNLRDDRKKNEDDPLGNVLLYRLRRDALFIVSNLNRGRVVETDTIKRQLLFVQSQLCSAAVADPCLSANLRTILVKFHAATISENLQDRRGSKRRLPIEAMAAAF